MKRVIVLAILAASGCATPPEKIADVQMSSAEYSGKDCAALKADQARSAMTLKNTSKEQQRIATNDAVGVLLLGVPMGSIGGDMETAVAVEKGRLAAIAAEMTRKGC